jgi:hypothetical protein
MIGELATHCQTMPYYITCRAVTFYDPFIWAVPQRVPLFNSAVLVLYTLIEVEVAYGRLPPHGYSLRSFWCSLRSGFRLTSRLRLTLLRIYTGSIRPFRFLFGK